MSEAIELLIDRGNRYREAHQPELALQCYADAMMQMPTNAAAHNNFGIVLRECGMPEASMPFLKRAIELHPEYDTAQFNLAVSLLISGDLVEGFKQYESRWNYEHLKGQLPEYSAPRWNGEDLNGKTIFILCEQGLGDNIQFSRYTRDLYEMGARVIFRVTETMHTLYDRSWIHRLVGSADLLPDFDYWTPIMSIPRILGVTYETMRSPKRYIHSDDSIVAEWQDRLDEWTKPRIGFSWSGRRDTWINQHKAVPFENIAALIKRNPQYEWVNLQVDATPQEAHSLAELGCATYPGTIKCMADTAGLMECMDLVLSVDTAVTHLSCALGRPTWVMLSHYGLDWRWLLNRDDSPWYPTAKLYRQPRIDDWDSVMQRVDKDLLERFFGKDLLERFFG